MNTLDSSASFVGRPGAKELLDEALAAYDKFIWNEEEGLSCDTWNADRAPGICYTTDWEGKPVVGDRMHQTLAEAIDIAAVIHRVTGKQEYADNYAEFMVYLDEVVLDYVHGSWYHQFNYNMVKRMLVERRKAE